MTTISNTVVLAVTESDAHVVGNKLAELYLTQLGYNVVNCGATTSLDEIAATLKRHPDALAVAIGSHNGHALEDLRGLRELRKTGAIRCPVVLGGNLGCGRQRDHVTERQRLLLAGVDILLESIEDLPPFLSTLRTDARPERIG